MAKTNITMENLMQSENNNYEVPQEISNLSNIETFEQLIEKDENTLVSQLNSIDSQYICLTAKIIYTLRKKIPSNQGWGEYIKTVIPQWDNANSSSQKARVINLGEFLYRNQIEEIDSRINLTAYYKLADYKKLDADGNHISDKVYHEAIKKPMKLDKIQERLEKLYNDKVVVHTVVKVDDEQLSRKELLKRQLLALKEEEKQEAKQQKEIEKIELKKNKLMTKRQAIEQQLQDLDSFALVKDNDDFLIKSILNLLNKNDFDYNHKKWLCERVIESLS